MFHYDYLHMFLCLCLPGRNGIITNMHYFSTNNSPCIVDRNNEVEGTKGSLLKIGQMII